MLHCLESIEKLHNYLKIYKSFILKRYFPKTYLCTQKKNLEQIRCIHMHIRISADFNQLLAKYLHYNSATDRGGHSPNQGEATLSNQGEATPPNQGRPLRLT